MISYFFDGLVLALALVLPCEAQAGRVRTLETNDHTMAEVRLAMGRSTILRFEEKPKSAVVGNQNYVALEYIGSDITLQPQGVTVTNLFVYTEDQTYGLILKVGGRGETLYDDLVVVRWKPGYVDQTVAPKKPYRLVSETPLNRHLELPGQLRLDLGKAIQSIAQGISVLEFTATNLSKEPVAATDIQVTVEVEGGQSPSQKAVLLEDRLAPGAQGSGRVILRLTKWNAATITVLFHGKTARLTLPKRMPISPG